MLLLSLILITCDTKNNVEPTFKNYFIRYYGEDGNHEAKDFVVTNDGGVIIVGTITTGLDRRVYVLKTDLEGNELWSFDLDSEINEFVQDIEPITEGVHADKFVILSNAQVNDNVLETRFTVINTNGVVEIRTKLQTKLLSQEGISITSLQTGGSGGFFLTGRTTDWDSTNANSSLIVPPEIIEDLLVVRLNQNLDTVRFDRIGGSYTGLAVKVMQLNTNSFTYCGHWDGTTDGRLQNEPKIESNIFFRTFTENPSAVPSLYAGTLSLQERLVAVARTTFGGVAIATQSDDNGINKKVFAVSTNRDFSSVLGEGVLLGNSDEFEAVSVSSGTSRFYVLANQINSQGNRDIYLKRIDSFLLSDLDLTFGSENNDDRGTAVAELPNGDILILGTMELAGQQDKIALIKVRADGTF
jgi:hypothetical protein